MAYDTVLTGPPQVKLKINRDIGTTACASHYDNKPIPYMLESYSFNQHRHNYATWTAARAVQRNFTTTLKIKFAIDHSGLKEFAESEEEITSDQFNQLHKQWASRLDAAFRSIGVMNCSYGRAAKIISIYLKTAIILCSKATCTRSSFIHPPIDGILLNNISERVGLKDLKSLRWTSFTEEEYWALVDRLKVKFELFNWKLEYYWSPELDK